jgi:hypothetical protein
MSKVGNHIGHIIKDKAIFFPQRTVLRRTKHYSQLSVRKEIVTMHLSSIFSLLLMASVAVATPTPIDKRACSPVGISAQSSSAVVSAFKNSGIVSDLISGISPKVAVTAKYGSKQVNLGNKFTTLRT